MLVLANILYSKIGLILAQFISTRYLEYLADVQIYSIEGHLISCVMPVTHVGTTYLHTNQTISPHNNNSPSISLHTYARIRIWYLYSAHSTHAWMCRKNETGK